MRKFAIQFVDDSGRAESEDCLILIRNLLRVRCVSMDAAPLRCPHLRADDSVDPVLSATLCRPTSPHDGGLSSRFSVGQKSLSD
jgi:hypothetical protein